MNDGGLAAERCEACRKDSPRVQDHELPRLQEQVPAWQLAERNGVRQLERVFRFRSYPQALAFVQQVGELAEHEGHHPVMVVEARRVTVTWWTHAIQDLHRNDFVMAAKTDAVASVD